MIAPRPQIGRIEQNQFDFAAKARAQIDASEVAETLARGKPCQRDDLRLALDPAAALVALGNRLGAFDRGITMRPLPWLAVEPYRQPDTPGYRSRYGDPYGVFLIRFRGLDFYAIATDGDHKASGIGEEYAWEHVSVSLRNRCPSWEEMSHIKSLFWRDDECVMQLHVPAADYKNMARNCLHLWRPLLLEIPRPPNGAVA